MTHNHVVQKQMNFQWVKVPIGDSTNLNSNIFGYININTKRKLCTNRATLYLGWRSDSPTHTNKPAKCVSDIAIN